jgi:hypothetical protein
MAYLFASQSNVDNYSLNYSVTTGIPYYENNHEGFLVQKAYHNILQGIVEARIETRGEIIQLGSTTIQGSPSIMGGQGYYSPNRILMGISALSASSLTASVYKVFDAWTDTDINANDSYKVSIYAKNDLFLTTEKASIKLYDGQTNFGILDSTYTKFFCTDFKYSSALNSGYALMSFGDSATAANNWHIGSEGNGDFNFYNGNRGSGTKNLTITSDGTLIILKGSRPGGEPHVKVFCPGNDIEFWDIQSANTIALYGVGDQTVAKIKLGSGGGTLQGASNAIGVSNLAGNAGSISVDANGYFIRTVSDIALKQNIKTLTGSLAVVEKMHPVSFDWIDTAKYGSQREVGFIAQEMETIVPEVIGQSMDGIKSLEYSKLVAVMAGAIQELSAKVKYLESLLTGSV